MSFTSIYNELKKEYPDVVSTAQLIKICHIGKRHAAYLLENNIIPCEDNGKKTRRYKIKLKDVARYMADRPLLPGNAFSRRRVKHSYEVLNKSPEYMEKMRKYYEKLLEYRPEIMGTNEVAEILGRDRSLVRHYISKCKLTAVYACGKYHISKEDLIEMLLSRDFRTGNARDFEVMFKEILLE